MPRGIAGLNATTLRLGYGSRLAEWRRQGFTLETIAQRAGCSRQRIHQVLHRFYPESLPNNFFSSRQGARVCGISLGAFLKLVHRLGMKPAVTGKRSFRWTEDQVERVREFLNGLQCQYCGSGLKYPRRRFCSELCARRSRHHTAKRLA